MNDQQAQCQGECQDCAAHAPKPSMVVTGTAKISVTPIESFGELLLSAEKVANLTEIDSTDAALAMSASQGAIAAALHSNTAAGAESDGVLAEGLAGVLVGVFQIAALESMPVEFLLEKARQRLEGEAQKAAIEGVRNFFADRGLANV